MHLYPTEDQSLNISLMRDEGGFPKLIALQKKLQQATGEEAEAIADEIAGIIKGLGKLYTNVVPEILALYKPISF